MLKLLRNFKEDKAKYKASVYISSFKLSSSFLKKGTKIRFSYHTRPYYKNLRKSKCCDLVFTIMSFASLRLVMGTLVKHFIRHAILISTRLVLQIKETINILLLLA